MQVRRRPGAYWEHRADPDLEAVVTHDFVAARWQRTVAAVLGQGGDDVSVERLLHTIVERWLIDRFRETERGSVSRTLVKHLNGHDQFSKVPAGHAGAGRWRLAGTQQPPWVGSLDELVTAAWTVRAVAVRWTSDTRRAPIASAANLSAVLRAVMAAAAGSVSEQQLVEVIVRRFPATLSTPVSPPGVLDEATEQVADSQPLPADLWQARQDVAAAAEAAVAVVRQLTGHDRHVLRLLADVGSAEAVRQLQKELGCGRSRAYQHLERVRGLVRELAGAFDDEEQVVLDVLAMCQAEGDVSGTVDDGGDEPSNTSEGPANAEGRTS
ncbi:hypothetical protein HH310_25575 [Actinoplanes sp. TBRC 11911]|uniref:hypothetical protein n=1 Tax=Actinoplanes sp. TBRC 11911 TaxID=2729386 RepID=UPI00145DD19A|nr:hypothetical protein [Actinoplanes sp. TBRC 11911]NMO54540.1 hypothetical protein [Actinoplanes sp. TBRC 11911]